PLKRDLLNGLRWSTGRDWPVMPRRIDVRCRMHPHLCNRIVRPAYEVLREEPERQPEQPHQELSSTVGFVLDLDLHEKRVVAIELNWLRQIDDLHIRLPFSAMILLVSEPTPSIPISTVSSSESRCPVSIPLPPGNVPVPKNSPG